MITGSTCFAVSSSWHLHLWVISAYFSLFWKSLFPCEYEWRLTLVVENSIWFCSLLLQPLSLLWFQIQLLVYRALSHYLLLPWPNLSETEQDWTNRATYHRDFSCQLTMEYCQLKDTQALIENKTLQQQGESHPFLTLFSFFLSSFHDLLNGKREGWDEREMKKNIFRWNTFWLILLLPWMYLCLYQT